MKKLLLLLTVLFSSLLLHAQIIPNAGFENWTNVPLPDEPDGWNTNNSIVFKSTTFTAVAKVGNSTEGAFGVKLITTDINGSKIPGAAAIGEIPTGFTLRGGMPFTERPDSIIFDYKSSFTLPDSGVILVNFKKNGSIVSYQQIYLTGNNSSFVNQRIKIQYLSPNTPDSLYFLILSSNILGGPKDGSTVEVDNIEFKGGTAQLPNRSFENWHTTSFEDLSNWFTFNSFTNGENLLSAKKTTDKHAGTYALMLETIYSELFDTIAFITTGQITQTGVLGGFPITNFPTSLSGYYKYTPQGNDSAVIAVYFRKNGVYIDSVIKVLGPASSYTLFDIPIDYTWNPVPDSTNIGISSSNFYGDINNIGIGSKLYLDDLVFSGSTNVSAKEIQEPLNGLKISPNPANDIIKIEFGNSLDQDLSITILDITGKLILTETQESFRTYGEIDISSLAAGTYFIICNTNSASTISKVIVSR